MVAKLRSWLPGAAWLGASLVVAISMPAAAVPDSDSSALLQKLEVRRGRPLAPAQRREFARIASELRQALLPAHDRFARSLGQIFRLSPPQLQAIVPSVVLPSAADSYGLMPRIEASLGRAMTADELQRLRIADNVMQAEINELLDRYVRDLADLAGMNKDQVRRLFPTMGI